MPGGVSPGAFDRLLTALDADRDRAAQAYEHLRDRTTGLLRWWGAADAEDLADVTLDRVARKLEEGVAIAEGSFGAYVRGVARMIFYEAQRRPKLQAGDAIHLAPPPSSDHDWLVCLDTCLDTLSPSERTLVLRYYGDGKPSDVRRRLGLELGVTMTALRIRAHRLRAQLERCVRECTCRSETLSGFPSSGSEGGLRD
jgi:DNA-directed RNA polymerase specialized sigma24 family protein